MKWFKYGEAASQEQAPVLVKVGWCKTFG